MQTQVPDIGAKAAYDAPLDTTVDTFLGPPFGSTAAKYLKRTDRGGGIQGHHLLPSQQISITYSKDPDPETNSLDP